MTRLRVLVTGPGGRVGRYLLPSFQERYDLSVADRQPVPGVSDTIICDLQDPAVLLQAMAGVDVVVHLAATADEAPFVENLVPNNVVGVYNVFHSAVQAGVRRVVFASTVQTVMWKRMQAPVHPSDPPRPLTTYGATKVFGEVLGRYFHDHHGLEFVAIRIGAFQPYDSKWLLGPNGPHNVWLSPRDAVDLLQRAVETPGIGYGVVFGTSKPRETVLSLDETRDLLGYEPQDDIADYAP